MLRGASAALLPAGRSSGCLRSFSGVSRDLSGAALQQQAAAACDAAAEGPPPPLPSRVGVLIVGGGLTGLTTAFELRRMQLRGASLPPPPEPQEDLPPAGAPGGPPGPPQPFVVLEAAERVGGCLESRRSACGDFMWDSGANSFRLTREALSLLRAAGLEDQLQTVPRGTPRFVAAAGGGLVPLPESLSSFAVSPLLSWRGKARLALGLLLGAPSSLRGCGVQTAQGAPDAPTVSAYISGVLGAEVEQKIAGAVVTGIYAGEPSQLSMQLSLPALKALLDRGILRSLAAAALHTARKLLQPLFSPATNELPKPPAAAAAAATVAGPGPSSENGHHNNLTGVANFRGGMQSLAVALARGLPPRAVYVHSKVTCIRPLSDEGVPSGFVATVCTPQGTRRLLASHVLLTLSPADTARVLGAPAAGGQAPLLGPAAVQQLQQLPFASLAVVSLALRPACGALQRPPPDDGLTPAGFGFLVSPSERSGGPSEGPPGGPWETLGALSVSRVFGWRAPPGCEILTGFLGGTADEAALQLSDEQLVRRLLRDLQRAWGPNKRVILLSDTQNPEGPQHTLPEGLPNAPQSGGAPKTAGGGRPSQEELRVHPNDSVYFYKVLCVRRWPKAVAQFGVQHSEALRSVNEELLQQQQQRHPKSRLLLDGGWVSGVSVGDRILAGIEAATVLAHPMQQQQQQEATAAASCSR